MECVLPPPKFVCSSTTGSPLCPERRLAAPLTKALKPSVRYVLAKNSFGSRYSDGALPLCTLAKSAANSAC